MGKVCENCKHFLRHYVRYVTGDFIGLDHGHCIYPRVKTREADTKACMHFTPAEPRES